MSLKRKSIVGLCLLDYMEGVPETIRAELSLSTIGDMAEMSMFNCCRVVYYGGVEGQWSAQRKHSNPSSGLLLPPPF